MVEAHNGGLLPPLPKSVLVYTDGGCDPKTGIGAWSYLAVPPGKQMSDAEHQVDGMAGTTNNRMELRAVIAALETLEIGPRIIIVTDSEYVIKGCTVWGKNWVKKGWLNAQGDPVKNKDLWEKLLVLVELHAVRFDWVKGHSGNPMNEMCDALCTDMMGVLLKAVNSGETVPFDSYGDA